MTLNNATGCPLQGSPPGLMMPMASIPHNGTAVQSIRAEIRRLRADGFTPMQIEARVEEAACAANWPIPLDELRVLLAEEMAEPETAPEPEVIIPDLAAESEPAQPAATENAEAEADDAEARVRALWQVLLEFRSRDGAEPDREALASFARTIRQGIAEADAERIVAVVADMDPPEAADIAERIEAGGPLPTTPRHLREETGADIYGQSIPPPQWALRDFILTRGFHIIGAKSNSGKSWIAGAGALALSTGGALSPRHEGDGIPRRVLYVSYEGYDQFKRRLQLLSRGMDLPLEGNTELHLRPSWPLLRDAKAREALSRKVRDDGIEVLILDPLQLAVGLEEDRQDGWLDFLRWGQELSADVALVIVHHLRKGSALRQGGAAEKEDLSGPGGIIRALDVQYDVSVTDEAPTFRLTCVKARDIKFPGPASFRLDFYDNAARLNLIPESAADPKLAERKAEILDTLADGPQTPRKLRGRRNADLTRRAIEALEEEGLIVSGGDERQVLWFLRT